MEWIEKQTNVKNKNTRTTIKISITKYFDDSRKYISDPPAFNNNNALVKKKKKKKKKLTVGQDIVKSCVQFLRRFLLPWHRVRSSLQVADRQDRLYQENQRRIFDKHRDNHHPQGQMPSFWCKHFTINHVTQNFSRVRVLIHCDVNTKIYRPMFSFSLSYSNNLPSAIAEGGALSHWQSPLRFRSLYCFNKNTRWYAIFVL